MAYTVARKGGASHHQFETYDRLLRQQGVDIARMPRAPDPESPERWLYVWDRDDEAQAFAQELRKRSGDENWQVLEVNGETSEGPLGPILIQVDRQSNGWVFAIHPLSRVMLRSFYPDAKGPPTVFIGSGQQYHLSATQADFSDQIERIAAMLTDLTWEQILQLGCRVVDVESGEELLLDCVPF